MPRPHLLGRELNWPGHFGAFWITSYFEKGCRKKCTRQSRKALWVVLSSLCFSKKFERIDTKGHGNVFASAKVHSTATVVRNRVLIITHVTFRDYRVHIFSDNLSRNSCIAVYISLLCRGIWRSLKGWGEDKKSARATMGRGRTSTEQRAIFEFVKVCWIRFFKWESFIGFCN